MEKTPPPPPPPWQVFITPIFFSLLAISPPPLLKKLIIGIIYGACSKSLSVLTRAPSVCLIENCRQFYQNYPNIVFSSYCIEVIGESRQLSCLKETMDNNKIWIVSIKKSSRSGLLQWFLSDTVIDWTKVILLTKSSWNHQKWSRFTVDETFLTGGKSSNKLLFLKPYTWPLFRFRGLSWLIFKQVLYTFMYRYLCRFL